MRTGIITHRILDVGEPVVTIAGCKYKFNDKSRSFGSKLREGDAVEFTADNGVISFVKKVSEFKPANTIPPTQINPITPPNTQAPPAPVAQAPRVQAPDKDRLIVRQSSLAQAVKTWCCANHPAMTPEETTAEIKKIAEEFEEWVFRDN